MSIDGDREEYREEKRLVYVPKSTIDRVLDIVRRKGVTISKFVGDALQLYIQLTEMEYSIEEVEALLKVFKMLKPLGGLFMPRSVLECVENSSCNNHSEKVKRWYEAGRAYGVYLRERLSDPIKTLGVFIKVLRWDLDEVSVEKIGNKYKIRCVSPAFSEEDTKIFAEFIRGVLEGLRMRIVSVESVRGLIVVEFHPLI